MSKKNRSAGELPALHRVGKQLDARYVEVAEAWSAIQAVRAWAVPEHEMTWNADDELDAAQAHLEKLAHRLEVRRGELPDLIEQAELEAIEHQGYAERPLWSS